MIGIYSIPFDQYETADGISKHGLDALAISPLHHWSWYRNPERVKPKETPAKVLGNAIHTAILEPDRFEKEYLQEPDIKDYPGSLDKLDDYKAACRERGLAVSGTKAELGNRLLDHGFDPNLIWDGRYKRLTDGKKVLSQIDWRVTKAITARVRKHPAASLLFQDGKAEQSIFWVDKETGLQCKGRIDWLTKHTDDLIVDLKSTNDASPEGFQRSITKYRYYVQAAMYVDGLQQIGLNPEGFIFAAWEKTAPYASALYYATQDMLEAGRIEYRRLLKTYADCLSKDKWPGYSEKVEPIFLPENFKPSSPESELEDSWLDEMENG